ncbi:hypothetical protein [Streptomyces yerevanensis]|uniref:hypothetical protein n=1 Tax=Streptomyces yerevanensis TaxID=66378 RepID=UPI000AD38B36|nr:hypothetical protein [Streptomyces yerevanensis]
MHGITRRHLAPIDNSGELTLHSVDHPAAGTAAGAGGPSRLMTLVDPPQAG